METTQEKKSKKEKTLAHKIVMGINLMTISLLIALGVMVYIRVKAVNDVQFTENLGNIMRLTDTTISAFLNGSSTELSLFGDSYLMAREDPMTVEERILECEMNFVDNTEHILSASITVEGTGECFELPRRTENCSHKWSSRNREDTGCY